MTENPTIEGVVTESDVSDEPKYESFWGVQRTERHYLPDGKQYFDYKIMNEAMKADFQKRTNQDLIVGRDQTARVKTDPSHERHTLIKLSVVDWYMYAPDNKGNMGLVAFSPQLLEKWLQVADPKHVEELEFAIRMSNPWMQDNMSVEEIDKEIDRLHEVRRQVVDRAAGEAGSAIK